MTNFDPIATSGLIGTGRSVPDGEAAWNSLSADFFQVERALWGNFRWRDDRVRGTSSQTAPAKTMFRLGFDPVRFCILLFGLLLMTPNGWAQWGVPWSRGAAQKQGRPAVSRHHAVQPGPAIGADPHSLPVAGIDAALSAPAPPWHYERQDPAWEHAIRAEERRHHQLDRMLLYRTREQKYADDFHDRYATGDVFYHMSRSRLVAPEIIDPAAWAPPGGWGKASVGAREPVAGMSYSGSRKGGRGHLPDSELPEQLRAAANRLTSSLSRMRDGDFWTDQLQPGRIIASIDRADQPASLSDLVAHYEGVARNPRLVLVAQANGFEETHRWLARYVLLPSRFPGEDHPWEPAVVLPVQIDPASNHSPGDTVVPVPDPDAEPEPESLRLEPATPAAPAMPTEVEVLPVPRGEIER